MITRYRIREILPNARNTLSDLASVSTYVKYCKQCDAGKFTSSAGSTTCYVCAPGKYIIYNVGCEKCAIGSYTSADSSTGCTTCAISTYTSSIGSTACAACSPGKYNVSDLRCGDCDIGTYAAANASTACTKCPGGTNTSAVGMVICDACIQGASTPVRDSNGKKTFINGTIQCIKCRECTPWTVHFSQCTDTTHHVCAVCDRVGLYAAFPWKGRCVHYSETPGVATLSQTPAGYLPVSVIYNVTNYATKKIASFTADSMTGADFSGDTITTNMFVPCAPPPLGRRFKEWSSFQSKSSTETCSSVDECLNMRAQCDLAASTECSGWNSTAKMGWYASAPGECTLCPSSSNYSTCNWGFYRNLSDCMPDRQSACSPCHGTLPRNAVWTTSKSPHYFDDSEPTPCNWDCDKGFYKDGDTCTACIKPMNSEFDYGPYIAYGNNNPPAKTCLDPNTCKYFGGIKGFSCAWKCPNEFKLEDFQDAGLKCVPCPALSCAADEITVFKDTCSICLKCYSIVANAVYQPGCTFTCAPGFFRFNATYCKQCTAKTCSTGFYSGGCTDDSDNTCLPCTVCASGFGVANTCSATADTVCAECIADLIPYGTYDSNCNVVCRDGYVMSNGECKACAVSDSSCMLGYKRSATCTPEDLGCVRCDKPTYNGCWVSGLTSCLWDCAVNFTKVGTNCVRDLKKTRNPCIGEIFGPENTARPTTTSVAATTRPATTTTALPSTQKPAATTRPATTMPAALPFTTEVIIYPVVIKEAITVANTTLSQCACVSKMIESEFSTLYRTTAFVLSCASGTTTIECPNYMCPCSTGRRLLTQADVVQLTLVYIRYSQQQITNTMRTEAMQRVISDAVVVSSDEVLLDVKTINYDEVAPSSVVVPLVLIMAAIIACCACCWKFSRRKTPPPNTLPYKIIKP